MKLQRFVWKYEFLINIDYSNLRYQRKLNFVLREERQIMVNNSFLSPEEIVENFLEYLDNSKYSYAFMLDGTWGTGKTFFVKEQLIPAVMQHETEKHAANHEYKEKKVLYVSLYGIKETDEISRLLYVELRRAYTDEVTKNQFPDIVEKNKSKITSWIGKGAKIFADVVKDSKGIDLEDIFNQISSGFSLENCIFVFDDLERTSCNINDILGYINNFIEHDGIKVLLIANEEEINTASQLDTNPEELLVCLHDSLDFGFLESDDEKPIKKRNYMYNSNATSVQQKLSLDKLMKRVEVLFARNQAYKQIKEKVVGETVKYQPDYLLMIKSLSESHLKDNRVLRKIVIDRAKKFNEIAIHYRHFNLRTFLFFLSKLEMIFNCLQEHTQTVAKMVDYVFLVSIKCKTGSKIEEWSDLRLFETRPLYGMLDFRNQCLAFRFIDNYVLYGKFDPNEIIDAVSLYEYYEQKNADDVNDPAKIIQHWWNMREQTLLELMDQILERMENNSYSFELYPQILNNFVSLVSIGFDYSYLDRLMEYMKKNIGGTSETIDLRGSHTSFAGEDDRRLYALKIKELNEAVAEKNENYQKDELSEMLSDVISWGSKVSDFVKTHRNVEENSFIAKIDASVILDLIDKSSAENIELFRYALGDFYSFSNIVDYYKDDYSNLKIIHDGLNPDNPEYDLIKKVNIRWLKDLIARKMELLSPESPEDSENGADEDNSANSSACEE